MRSLFMPAYWPRFSSSRSWRSISAFDVERLLAGALAALVAGDDEAADLGAQLLVLAQRGAAALIGGEQLLQLRVDVDRLVAAGLGAIGARLEHLADLGLALGAARRPRRPGARAGNSCSIANGPLPISFSALPAPVAKASAAKGIASSATTIRTIPLSSGRRAP